MFLVRDVAETTYNYAGTVTVGKFASLLHLLLNAAVEAVVLYLSVDLTCRRNRRSYHLENIIREILTSATAAPARTMIMAKAFIFDDTSWKLLDRLKVETLLSFWVG